MITLYDMALSGNCHKIRLMLSLLGLPYQLVALTGGAQHSPEHLQRNPFAQAPVIDDDGLVIRDSQAILVYLARRYGGSQWWPDDAATLAQIVGWLSTSANEIANGPALLRVHHKFGRDIDSARASQISNKVMAIIDAHLASREWLVGDRVSIADIAVYPYLALAHEGNIDLGSYPHLGGWFRRIEALPGYLTMPGLTPA